MARLIDAHDLWSDIMMLPHNGDMISSEEVEQAIKDSPTVDAVEVKRGQWLNSHTVAFTEECSQCGFCVDWTGNGMLHNYNYCPNCGAKMEELK